MRSLYLVLYVSGRNKEMIKRGLKKLLTVAAVASMTIGLVGCGSGDKKITKYYSADEAQKTKALVIGDYDINMDEMALYAMQEAITYGVTSSALTDDSTIETNKSYALSLLRQNKIIYNVAKNNNVELDDSDKDYINKNIESFRGKISQEVLDAYGITDDTIQRVFEEQAMASKFQNDIKNEMGSKIQADLEEQYKDAVFTDYYYMLFPTVEIDSGSPKKDSDGNYVYVSDDKKAEVKSNAEAAMKEIQGGASYETVADKYGVTDYSRDDTGYTDGYGDDEIDKIMNNLKTGECAGPIEDTLGYAVIVMVNDNDEDLKSNFISYSAQSTESDQFKTLQNQWLATIPVDEENDLQGTVWADFDFKGLVKNLENCGAITAD